MAALIRIGDCVKIPDGRIARVRERLTGKYKVRVRRKTGKTHQFLIFPVDQLNLVDCPKGWMSREGYNRYLKITLSKMEKRLAAGRRSKK
jgi:GTP-binding protein EngB required for normal cell division